jgi:hypothetical protein
LDTDASKPTAHAHGSIDESERKFSLEERKIAEILESEGKHIRALVEGEQAGRVADALVGEQPLSKEYPGIQTEFKVLYRNATSATVRNSINNSIRRGGQARHIILYALGSGLSEVEGERGLARARSITRGRVDSVRIIGDGFDITSTDFAQEIG